MFKVKSRFSKFNPYFQNQIEIFRINKPRFLQLNQDLQNQIEIFEIINPDF